MQWKCKHYFFYFAPISEHNNTKYKCLTFNCPRLKFKTLTSHTNKHTMLVAKVSKGRLHLDMWVSLIVWPDGYIQQWKRLPKLYSLPITEGTLDRLPKIFKILPNWWILTNVVMLHLAQKLGYKNVYKTSVLFWDELSDVIYRKGNRTDGLLPKIS